MGLSAQQRIPGSVRTSRRPSGVPRTHGGQVVPHKMERAPRSSAGFEHIRVLPQPWLLQPGPPLVLVARLWHGTTTVVGAGGEGAPQPPPECQVEHLQPHLGASPSTGSPARAGEGPRTAHRMGDHCQQPHTPPVALVPPPKPGPHRSAGTWGHRMLLASPLAPTPHPQSTGSFLEVSSPPRGPPPPPSPGKHQEPALGKTKGHPPPSCTQTWTPPPTSSSRAFGEMKGSSQGGPSPITHPPPPAQPHTPAQAQPQGAAALAPPHGGL